MSPQDDLIYTLIGLAVTIGLACLAYYQAHKPWDKLTPRMVPWMPIMLGCAATALMLFIHLVNLMGFQTGSMSRIG